MPSWLCLLLGLQLDPRPCSLSNLPLALSPGSTQLKTLLGQILASVSYYRGYSNPALWVGSSPPSAALQRPLPPCWGSAILRHRLWDSTSGGNRGWQPISSAGLRWGGGPARSTNPGETGLWFLEICSSAVGGTNLLFWPIMCLRSFLPVRGQPRAWGCVTSWLLTTDHGPIPPALAFLLVGRGWARWRTRHLHCFLSKKYRKKYNCGKSMQLMHKLNLSTGLEVCLSPIRLLQPFSFSPRMLLSLLCRSPFLDCSRPGWGHEQFKAPFCLLPPHWISQSFLKLSYKATDIMIRRHTEHQPAPCNGSCKMASVLHRGCRTEPLGGLLGKVFCR